MSVISDSPNIVKKVYNTLGVLLNVCICLFKNIIIKNIKKNLQKTCKVA